MEGIHPRAEPDSGARRRFQKVSRARQAQPLRRSLSSPASSFDTLRGWLKSTAADDEEGA